MGKRKSLCIVLIALSLVIAMSCPFVKGFAETESIYWPAYEHGDDTHDIAGWSVGSAIPAAEELAAKNIKYINTQGELYIQSSKVDVKNIYANSDAVMLFKKGNLFPDQAICINVGDGDKNAESIEKIITEARTDASCKIGIKVYSYIDGAWELVLEKTGETGLGERNALIAEYPLRTEDKCLMIEDTFYVAKESSPELKEDQERVKKIIVNIGTPVKKFMSARTWQIVMGGSTLAIVLIIAYAGYSISRKKRK